MFNDRLNQRYEAWWAPPTGLYKPSQLKNTAERYLQRRVQLTRDDPLSRWQRGKHWQRRLNNKWNAREFAAMHGIEVPELYWSGRNPGKIPFKDLPASFVIRSAWGSASRQVYVVHEGKEQLRDAAFNADEALSNLSAHQSGFWPFSILVEEHLVGPGECDQPVVEYSIHNFNGETAAIVAVQGRTLNRAQRVNFYTPDWNPTPEPLRNRYPERFDFPKPARLDQLLESAAQLGRVFGSYVRVDLYETDRGVVFGEFASFPADGVGFSDFAESLFEDYWVKFCDDGL